MKFVLPFDKTVATVKGHAIEFKAGVPTHVPKECWSEVRSHGAVAEDAKAVEDAEKKPVRRTEADPDKREETINTAFAMMVEANKRGDFDPSGSPAMKALSKIVGFDVDIKERDALWATYKAQHLV